MLFQDEVPEDKGLFTFYRQQAERDEELKRQRRLRKKRRQEEAQQASRSTLPKDQQHTPRQPQTKHYLPKTIHHPKEPPPPKPKPLLPKQRLLESIVDMGKDIDPQPDINDRHLVALRHREPSHILRSRRYREKAQGEWTVGIGEDVGVGADGLLIESLHRRNQSQQLYPPTKQAIHSVRGSVVELPDIRKSEEGRQGREGKMPYRPKKSLKSKLIQDALLSRDRDKIKQIRTYLKAHSPMREWQGEGVDGGEEEGDGGMQIFQFRQQKLLAVLKRFRRG